MMSDSQTDSENLACWKAEETEAEARSLGTGRQACW